MEGKGEGVVNGANGACVRLRGLWTFIREVEKERRAGREGGGVRERLKNGLSVALGRLTTDAVPAVPRRHGLSAWSKWQRGGMLVEVELPRGFVCIGCAERAK